MSSGERPPRDDVPRRDEVIDDTAEADVRETQGFVPIVGNEKRSRAEDTRLATRRQRRKIGVDDGMLQIGERSVRSLLGSRLGAREHEAITRLAGAYASADRKGRLPHPVDELRRRRVEGVAAARGVPASAWRKVARC